MSAPTVEANLADLERMAAQHSTTKVRNDTVVVSWCRRDEVSGGFLDSMVGLLIHDSGTSKVAGRGNHIMRASGGTIALRTGPRIAEGRSQIVDTFLTHPLHKDAGWLLMIDTDMTFDGDIVDRLLEVADPQHAPIIGGLCFAGQPYGRIFPTVYRAYNEEGGHLAIEPVDDLPDTDGLVKVGATGAACLLVHRQVYIAMLNRFGKTADGRPNPYPWFAEGLTTAKGIPLGEDVAFCRKAMMLGIPIHVHMGVQVGHEKVANLDRAAFDRYRASLPAEGG